MSHSINTGYAVIVLGDRETIGRDDLADKAAESGALIAETYCFDPGEAAGQDDITDVPAVVTAVGRAIATRTDIWMPFPMPDFGREAHLRRISLVLQRHGLNILFGPSLEPCALDGGFSEIDFALRAEVRAVDDLDRAALARAGVATLEAEIRQALTAPPVGRAAVEAPLSCEFPDCPPDPAWPFVEKYFSTAEVARIFGRSTQWVYWGMRTGVFTRPDGTAIEPLRVGANGRRRFTVPVLQEMAHACHRRGILNEADLHVLLDALDREGG